jgi:formate hydrogenlyase subunit 3/multisubunit Na+/H+ antiporter MnhD subunit
MKDIFPTVIIGLIYILAIIFGRKWMKNEKSFELRHFMFIYNLLQVIICAYITYEV